MAGPIGLAARLLALWSAEDFGAWQELVARELGVRDRDGLVALGFLCGTIAGADREVFGDDEASRRAADFAFVAMDSGA